MIYICLRLLTTTYAWKVFSWNHNAKCSLRRSCPVNQIWIYDMFQILSCPKRLVKSKKIYHASSDLLSLRLTTHWEQFSEKLAVWLAGFDKHGNKLEFTHWEEELEQASSCSQRVGTLMLDQASPWRRSSVLEQVTWSTMLVKFIWSCAAALIVK